MKSIVSFLSILGLTSACGNYDFSEQSHGFNLNQIQNTTTGLQLTVKNSLPLEQTERRGLIKPDLNVFFCAPIKIDQAQTPPEYDRDRCVKITGVVRNGNTETFLVPPHDVQKIYSKGKGLGAFEFADNYQITSISWHCADPNHQVALSPDFHTKQIWSVEVNQRHAFSYGCLIQKH